MAYTHATGAGRVSGNLDRRQLIKAAVGSATAQASTAVARP